MIGHEAAEDENTEQRQHVADQPQRGQELLIEFQHVDHPPRYAGAGVGHRAKHENHHRSADQRRAQIRRKLACESRDQEQQNRHRAREHDLLL